MSVSLILDLLIFLHSLVQTLSADVHPIPTTITCRNTCGSIPIKYPFGTGFGCGNPGFTKYIRCNAGRTLLFSTSTGLYPITSIAYDRNTILVMDPLMSNCSSMQNSGSFSLDPAAPFTLTTNSIFVLLGCSTTSPVFDSNEDLCSKGSASHVCRGLYSCKGVTGIGFEPNAPISTCCVYDSPMGHGSGYVIDLPKLQCSSYTCISGYGKDEGDPKKWSYGISLKYNSSFVPDACKHCEESGGTCGYMGVRESFACICRNGINTVTNCYGQGYAWSGAWGPNIHSNLSIQGQIILWFFLFTVVYRR